MEKCIILATDGTFVIIVHACPNAIGKFQWYLVDEPNSEKKYILDGQTYESIVISSADICNNYLNKWLCCKCEIENDTYTEGCVYLANDFLELIKVNQFDVINFFGKDGDIRNDISYLRPVDRQEVKDETCISAVPASASDTPPLRKKGKGVHLRAYIRSAFFVLANNFYCLMFFEFVREYEFVGTILTLLSGMCWLASIYYVVVALNLSVHKDRLIRNEEIRKALGEDGYAKN